MAGRTSKKSKVAETAAGKRVAAKAAKPRKTAAESHRKVPKPALLEPRRRSRPGWERDVGRPLDALIVRTVFGVRKAVKWNSPFYGIEGQGWFLSFHRFTKYVKVTFFRAPHCVLSLPANTRTCATSTSTRTSSTRGAWRVGLRRHRSCPAGSRRCDGTRC